ncbi:hypothetical protein B0G38_002592 [Arthrobacter sp. VKM Ac-2550]|nr:hypothetical protein [Arthrobacter sp. VKM Ac-2550]
MTGAPARRRFLKPGDVMDILNISRVQAFTLVRSGSLEGIQIGGRNYLQFNPAHKVESAGR